MKKQKNALINKIVIYIAIVLILIIAIVIQNNDLLYNLDMQIADKLYQRGDLQSGRVQIIEINEDSFQDLGPYNTWDRHVMASAIRALIADKECLPSIIGIDLLYIGETSEDADHDLVEACREARDLGVAVVTGSFANIESGMIREEDGSVYMGEYVSLYEEPFDELREVTYQGYTNGFLDKDGYIRHIMLNLDGNVAFSNIIFQLINGYANDEDLSDYENTSNTENFSAIRYDEKEYYIPYTSSRYGYSNGYSISKLIAGQVPLERLSRCIVLIGPYAEGMMDSFRTPIDHGNNMYGVEVHANIIESLMRGDLKETAPKLIELLITVLFILIMIYLCSKDRLWITITAMIGMSAIYIGICLGAYSLGYVLQVVYLPLFMLILGFANIGRHYIRAHFQKKQVENTFKRYVAPEIVDEIARTGLDEINLGGVNLDIAALFVDIRGFTTMSESLPPETVVEILNKYLSLTSECVFQNGGTLDKFVGDCTMALYNAPMPLDDYIYKAVKTGWDMVEGSRKLAKELEERFGRSVSFGVGVHIGPAVVGNIGSPKRMDYTAIGDTVNTAARLEANAPAGTVLVSKAVVDALGSRIQVESLGNLPLKGKNEPVEVFKVVDLLY